MCDTEAILGYKGNVKGKPYFFSSFQLLCVSFGLPQQIICSLADEAWPYTAWRLAFFDLDSAE